MRVPKAVLGGFLVVALLAAGAYLLFLNKGPSSPGDQEESAAPGAPGESAAPSPDQKAEAAPLPVKVAKAVMTLKSPGEAYTEKRVSMKAEVGGVVKYLYAAEGRHVKEGYILVEVDVKIARMDLEKTRIRAPFSGIITDIKLSPKERIDAGRELFTLVDISRIKVKAKVLESEVGKMRPGREVDLLFSAFPGRAFKGRIEAVSPVINAEDKTCAVHVIMDNPSEEVKPGMHAEVEIPTEIFSGRLLVPQKAILVRGGRKLVFAVEGGIAKWRYIEVGLENERFAEVLPGREPGWGVNEGDDVIVEGHVTLAHDTKVTIIE